MKHVGLFRGERERFFRTKNRFVGNLGFAHVCANDPPSIFAERRSPREFGAAVALFTGPSMRMSNGAEKLGPGLAFDAGSRGVWRRESRSESNARAFGVRTEKLDRKKGSKDVSFLKT